MKIAFYGSSLLSAYWNGAATYYRGLLCALAKRGYDITFYGRRTGTSIRRTGAASWSMPARSKA